MYIELYQYLLLHKQLSLPGVGTFSVERLPAVPDFPNKMINAPAYRFSMAADSHLPDKNFFHWLAQTVGITDREAVFRFNDFTFELKKQIAEGHSVWWNGLGTLSRGLAGEIKFQPEKERVSPEPSVSAEKVLREKPEHTVRVGEEERTAAEMTEMLSKTEEKKSYWWAWALALGLLCVLFLGWHFSEKGLEPAAAGNTQKLSAGEAGPSYRILP